MTVDELKNELSGLSAIGHGDKPVRLERLTNQNPEDPSHCDYDYDDLQSLVVRGIDVLVEF